MTNILFVFRRFLKSKYLRAVNLLGLSIIFACLILSYIHVKKELSYDRFNVNADRIARLSLQYNDEPIDGRIYGFRVLLCCQKFRVLSKPLLCQKSIRL